MNKEQIIYLNNGSPSNETKTKVVDVEMYPKVTDPELLRKLSAKAQYNVSSETENTDEAPLDVEEHETSLVRQLRASLQIIEDELFAIRSYIDSL